MIASPVPTVGRSPATPGKGVPSEKATAARAMAVTPTQPMTTLAADGIRPSVEAQSAIAAPSPSSQARAKGEKYAAVGAVDVSTID